MSSLSSLLTKPIPTLDGMSPRGFRLAPSLVGDWCSWLKQSRGSGVPGYRLSRKARINPVHHPLGRGVGDG